MHKIWCYNLNWSIQNDAGIISNFRNEIILLYCI